MTHRALVTNPKRWKRTRRDTFARDGHRCVSCGSAGPLECDHVTPLSVDPEQDPYDITNCQTLCRGCHIVKTAAENRRQPTETELRWRQLVDELR